MTSGECALYTIAMKQQLTDLENFIRASAQDPGFVHRKWFVQWHLEIVEKLARELLVKHPDADADLVIAMVWLHDYGKLLDFDSQHAREHIDAGRDKLMELGFGPAFAAKAADYIELADTKENLDQAPIEVQILASADGCSHLVGPFIRLWWWEHPGQPYEEIMKENIRKLTVDWEKKVVLPEARAAFQTRHDIALEQSGTLPGTFL